MKQPTDWAYMGALAAERPAASPLQVRFVRAAACAEVRDEAIRLHAGLPSMRALNHIIRNLPRQCVNPAEWFGL